MNAVAFRNMGVIDRRFINTFGVSAKEGTNPVGFFGTGLKYAIAICLREDCKVTIKAGNMVYGFEKVRGELRNKEFDFIEMLTDDSDGTGVSRQELPFTTELGKTWQLWQAFRELYCNATDEDGQVYESDGDELCAGDETVIIVEGENFHRCFLDRGLYLVPQDVVPLFSHSMADVLPGPCDALYMRNVRVRELNDQKSLFKYNVHFKCDLTEDRTLKYEHEARVACTTASVYAPREVLERILLAPKGSYEWNFDYAAQPAHEPFLDLVDELRMKQYSRLNKSAVDCLMRHRKKSISGDDAVVMTQLEKTMLDRAMIFLKDTLACAHLDDYRIFVVELDESTLGLAKGNEIFLNRRTFRMGTKMVASTLYEEYLHVHNRLRDCDREMQNFLMDTIATLGEQLRGEPV